MLSLLGIPVAFAVILILVMKKFSYGIAIFIGALIIGIFCGFGLHDLANVLIETLKNRETLDLTAIIILIGILGYSFKETGQINITVEELRKMTGERTVLAALPAVFGMLPIPGGALMSAPVIEPEANRLGLTPEEKTYINIWFRHTLLVIFPLSSILIVSARFAGISVYSLIVRLLPLFMVAVVIGFFVGLRPIKVTHKREEKGSLPKVLYGLSPIILVIFLNIVVRIDFAVGLFFGIVLLFLENKVSLKRAAFMVRKGFSWQMAVAMVGIMFFRQVINTSNIVEEVMSLLEGSPLVLLLVGLPLIISLLTGLAMLSVGISFPILVPLVPFSPPVVATILYTAAFTGYLASPLHLCLIVTKEYFKCSLSGVYKKFLPSVAIIVIYNIIFTLVFL